MLDLRDHFLLDPEIVYLNHGSFGACPRPVFQVYQDWQRKLESQPVEFLGRQFTRHDRQARQALGKTLNADPDDLVYIPNATYGVNIIARSLDLKPGDEVLSTDHEYGACDYTWEFICQKTGARYVRQPIQLPVSSAEEVVQQLWRGVTKNTRLIFVSHISSPTALRMPVDTICRRARQQGILTLIDGAHAPGQIHLDLTTIGADFYTGNCHKWMLSPKGAGFLHTRRERQPLIEPMIVSWGWKATSTSSGSSFVDYQAWRGTDDPAAALSVPAAIEFMEQNNWDFVRQECSELLDQALERITEVTNLAPVHTLPAGSVRQMGVAALPHIPDLAGFKNQLYERYRIEIPCIEWNGRQLLRLSVQGYNSTGDIDRLVQALSSLLPSV